MVIHKKQLFLYISLNQLIFFSFSYLNDLKNHIKQKVVGEQFPETTKASKQALHPEIGTTFISCSIASLTNSYPGSEIAG